MPEALRRPKLMLADVGHDNRLALRRLVDRLDDRLRHENAPVQGLQALRARTAASVDSRKPFAVGRRADARVHGQEKLLDVGRYAKIDRHVLVYRGGIAVDMDYLCAAGELRRAPAGDAVVEADAERDEKIGLGNRGIRVNAVSAGAYSSYSYDQLLTYLQNSPAYSVPGTVLSIIETIIGYVVEIVLVSFFLIFSRSPDPVFMKNYFEGYNKWARGILCGLWRLLWTTLWALIAIPVGIIYLLIITISGIDATSGITTTLFFVGLIIGLIPMFIKTIEYSFAFFFVSEFISPDLLKVIHTIVSIYLCHRHFILVNVLNC